MVYSLRVVESDVFDGPTVCLHVDFVDVFFGGLKGASVAVNDLLKYRRFPRLLCSADNDFGNSHLVIFV